MLWVYLTLLAVAIWGISNIIDKHVISLRVKDPLVPLVIDGFVVLFYSLAIFVVHGISIPNTFFILGSIVLGLLYFMVLLFYYKSMKLEEVSRAIPLMGLHPIITLLFATIFLGEIFSGIKYIGIFFLVAGGFMLVVKKGVRLTITKALPWLILFNLFIAIYYVFMKYLLGFSDFWSVFALAQIGFFIGFLFLLPFHFKETKRIIKTAKKTVGFVLVSQVFNFIGVLLYMAAASIGFISLVAALEQTQNIIVLFYAIILSIFMPKILKEEIKGSVILLKIIAIVCMFIGAYLII